jgi:ADP-heptose:LPS heptosyltransferase
VSALESTSNGNRPRVRSDHWRPQLTAVVEGVVAKVLASNSIRSAPPLASVPQRVLVVKVHGMGDSVMVRSIVGHLRMRHPSMQIGILAGVATREVMSIGSGCVLHDYNQSLLSIRGALRSLKEIRGRNYQALLNFEQGSLSGTAFLSAAGVPIRIGFIPLCESAKAAFLTHPIQFNDRDSMWRSILRLTRVLDPDLPEDLGTIPLPISREVLYSTDKWLAEHTQEGFSRLVVFHMGSGKGQLFRRWPVERFIELAAAVSHRAPGVKIALTGQPFERPLIDRFMRESDGCSLDASDFDSIEKTAALLQRSDLVVSNDTGVMHLAAAMGAPTVGIFGPDSPTRYAPVGPRASAVADNRVPCSPCNDIYRLRVPAQCSNDQEIRCLYDVSVDRVLQSARQVVVEPWLN